MFKICLFDLDDTLVRTEDMKEVREACKGNSDGQNLKAVEVSFNDKQGRLIYSLDMLREIRTVYPDLKLGVFTRSPRSYAIKVLNLAYPDFGWDIVIAYEDVRPTKPHGNGIKLAMNRFNVECLDQVMLVGDSDVDVRAAYNCGCIAVIDTSSWPTIKRQEHWRSLEYIPDALIDDPQDFLRLLAEPDSFLPELERLLASEQKVAADSRFDRINHFVPGNSTAHPVYVCGRSFTQYDSLKDRRKWHVLTKSIEDHKDVDQFSDEWIIAIRKFIAAKFRLVYKLHNGFRPVSIVVTVVPHRPGRKARMEALLMQLQGSLAQKPIKSCVVTFAPGLLAFRSGVKSQHNDHLNRDQRFVNIRDHLYVKEPQIVLGGKTVLVLDDVVTTGASLIYASNYLKASGARTVRCLAIAKSVSNVL